MTTKITADNLATSLLNTITAGGGPKITNIQITDNAYTVLDDTAVDVGGGYIKLTGTGFASGCSVLINNTPATSTTFISATEVRAQVPAQTAGSYVIYLVNTDGGVAIRVNGLTYSASPNWSTGSTLAGQTVDTAISIQLSASGATTYSLAAGSSLPAGLTLSSGGLLSGTVTGLGADTTYSFTVNATDTEYQDSPRTFSLTVTIVIADEYFRYTTLLLSGEGTNNAQNNTFVDSSTNNFAITRNGNTTQGTAGPFSQTGWSGYFDGSGDYLTIPTSDNLALGSGDWTVEAWIYATAAGYSSILGWRQNVSVSSRPDLYVWDTGVMVWYVNSTAVITGTTNVVNKGWTHVAVCKSGSSTKLFVNGVQEGSTYTDNITYLAPENVLNVGGFPGASQFLRGYLSNARVVKGTAVYTGNFTPAITPLTAIANTSLLTLQDNRFKDNSSNNFAITRAGDVSIQAFSPFNPTVVYDAAIHGASAYLDGTGDYLSLPDNSAFQFGTGDFTIEAWVYATSASAYGPQIYATDNSSAAGGLWLGWYVDTLYFRMGGGNDLTYTTPIPLGKWTHVAATRSSGTARVFINGVVVASGSRTQNITQQQPNIGYNKYDNNYHSGWISNLRVVKGTAVYTDTFTPPTAPVTAIANTSLLLNFANAGIQDATGRNVLETLGDAKISTAVKKYGTGSIAFDGNNDYLKPPLSPNFVLGIGDFTIEGWIYRAGDGASSSSAPQIICEFRTDEPETNLLIEKQSSTLKLEVYVNGASRIASSTDLSLNTWYHFAVVRLASSTKLYVNGVNEGTTYTDTNNYTSNSLVVGGRFAAFSGDFRSWNGYIDDLRITRGVARYTTTFTPPDRALPVR